MPDFSFEDLNPENKAPKSEGFSFDSLNPEKPKPAAPVKKEKQVKKQWGRKIDDYILETASNIPKDIVQTGADVFSAVSHPVQTFKNITKAPAELAAGALETGLRKVGVKPAPEFRNQLSPEEQRFHNLMGKVKWAIQNPGAATEKVLGKVKERPIAAAATIYGGATMGKQVAKATGAEKLAKGLDTVAKVANPTNVIKVPAKGVLSALSKTQLPERLARSATKYPLSAKWTKNVKEESKISKATKQQLEHEIKPNEKGIIKTEKLMSEDMKTVDRIIAKGSKEGGRMMTDDVIKRGLRAAYVKAARSSDPIGARAIVDNIAEKFRQHGPTLSHMTAQQIKRQLYDEVSWGASEATALQTQLNTLGKKGIASVIMKQLEKTYPEIAQYNKRYGALKDLKFAIERSSSRLANKDLVDLPSKVLFLKDPMVALFNWTIGHPEIKMQLAFALNRARKVGTANAPMFKSPVAPKQQPPLALPPGQGFKLRPSPPVDAAGRPVPQPPRQLETREQQVPERGFVMQPHQGEYIPPQKDKPLPKAPSVVDAEIVRKQLPPTKEAAATMERVAKRVESVESALKDGRIVKREHLEEVLKNIDDPALMKSMSEGRRKGIEKNIIKYMLENPDLYPLSAKDREGLFKRAKGSEKVKNNASGQTDASLEAIGEQKSRAKQGIKTYVVDSRTGKEHPAIGLRPEDNSINPHDVLIKRHPNGKVEIIKKGNKATNYRPK